MQQNPIVPTPKRAVPQTVPGGPPPRRRRKRTFMQVLMDNYIPNKRDSKRDLIRKIVLILAVCVLVGSLFYIASYYGESRNNKERTGALADLFSKNGNEADYKVSSEYDKLGYLKKFWPLYELNEDIAGWIEIEGTQVNYTVVQTDNNKYYERRDFDRKDNDHGVPFVDFRVDLKKPSTNTVIYAHNMNDGQMFGELMNYKSLAYYKQHPIVNFDSVYAEGKYKIVGIILCKKDDPEFSYHNFIEAKDGAELNAFMKKVSDRTIINTTVDVKEGDSLITLSTCDYTFKDPNTNDRIARFVVIGRKVREGESAVVDTSGATVNPNPIVPPEWASYLKKQQEEALKKQSKAASDGQYAELRKEAEKWFTASELAAISDDTLESDLANRKNLMMAYLSADELETLSVEKKVALLKERQNGESMVDLALQAIHEYSGLSWMTEDEKMAFAKELAQYNKERWTKMMERKALEAGNVELNLSESSLSLVAGANGYQLSVSVNGSDEQPRWTTDNRSVATVDQNGVITPLKAGTATISVTVGGRTISCVVTVEGEEESKPASKPESKPESSSSKVESSKPESSSSKVESSKPESSKPTASSKPTESSAASKPDSVAPPPSSSTPESSAPPSSSSTPESSAPPSSSSTPEESKPEESTPPEESSSVPPETTTPGAAATPSPGASNATDPDAGTPSAATP